MLKEVASRISCLNQVKSLGVINLADMLLIVLVFSAVLAAPNIDSSSRSVNGIIRVPLVRHKSPRQALFDAGHSVQSFPFEKDFSSKGSKPHPHPPRTNDSVSLHKYLDNEFYGDIGIGHPAQHFRVIFDTAWSNAWVPSSQCPLSNLACQIHNKYDSEHSSTYVENGEKFSIRLANNLTLDGFLSTDLVHMGHLSISNWTFAEITHVPREMFSNKADGVLGLGFSHLAVDNVEPFFYTLVKQKLISKPIFSVYFNRDPTTSYGGSLFLGGSDPKHFTGNFTLLPVNSNDYWQVHMDSMQVNLRSKNKTVSFCKLGCNIIIDTSSSGISGPRSDIERLNKILSIKKSPFFDRYVVSCSIVPKLPSVSLIFNSKKFTLKSAQYIVKMSFQHATVCVSAFTPSDRGDWSLGAAFMSKYYTEFNLERKLVGFALGKMW